MRRSTVDDWFILSCSLQTMCSVAMFSDTLYKPEFHIIFDSTVNALVFEMTLTPISVSWPWKRLEVTIGEREEKRFIAS